MSYLKCVILYLVKSVQDLFLGAFPIGGEIVGRPRKFKNAKALAEAWEEYKAWCNNQTVLTHDFSAKNSEFVSAKLQRSITCTIEGFCVWAGISRASFYEYYAANARYADIVTRMREECEVDARMKFELGMIDTRLAALWMSKHGYSTKVETAPAETQELDPLTQAIKEEMIQ